MLNIQTLPVPDALRAFLSLEEHAQSDAVPLLVDRPDITGEDIETLLKTPGGELFCLSAEALVPALYQKTQSLRRFVLLMNSVQKDWASSDILCSITEYPFCKEALKAAPPKELVLLAMILLRTAIEHVADDQAPYSRLWARQLLEKVDAPEGSSADMMHSLLLTAFESENASLPVLLWAVQRLEWLLD